MGKRRQEKGEGDKGTESKGEGGRQGGGSEKTFFYEIKGLWQGDFRASDFLTS